MLINSWAKKVEYSLLSEAEAALQMAGMRYSRGPSKSRHDLLLQLY